MNQGYPQGPQQGGYGPYQGAPMQQPPPPKKGASPLVIVLAVVGGLGLLGFGSCLVCAGMGAKAASDGAKQAENEAKQAAGAAGTATSGTPASGKPTSVAAVEIGTLLSEYKDNEVRADGSYKDKWIKTSGKVNDVKKDFGDSMYITVGTGKQFEIPEVQCHLEESEKSKAAALSKGKPITIVGKVDGLMMNVHVKQCTIQ